MIRRAALAALLAAGLLAAPPATAATSPAQARITLHEIEGEVMCTVCGELLELTESPQAQREKVFILRLATAGKSKQQIKDALVAQYGEAVLALPRGSGFNLSAYLVPIVAFLVAAIALAVGVVRWRRASGGGGGGPGGKGKPAPAGPSGEDSARLDADLARYDL